MPNWCNNSFSIEGPTEKISKLWEAVQNAKDGEGLLTAMVPIGEWDYGNAIDAWGTKWDVSAEGMEYSTGGDRASITGWFDSAWAPPINAFTSYCTNNPDVSASLEFFEPGGCFVGEWDNVSGEESYTIDPDNLDALPEEMREQWEIDSYYEDEADESDYIDEEDEDTKED